MTRGALPPRPAEPRGLTSIPSVLAPLYRALRRGLAVICRGDDGTFTLDLHGLPGLGPESLTDGTYAALREGCAAYVTLPPDFLLDYGRDGRAFVIAERLRTGERAYDAATMRWGVVRDLDADAEGRVLLEEDAACRRENGRLCPRNPMAALPFLACPGDLFLPAGGLVVRSTGEQACLEHRPMAALPKKEAVGRFSQGRPFYAPSLDRSLGPGAVTGR